MGESFIRFLDDLLFVPGLPKKRLRDKTITQGNNIIKIAGLILRK